METIHDGAFLSVRYMKVPLVRYHDISALGPKHPPSEGANNERIGLVYFCPPPHGMILSPLSVFHLILFPFSSSRAMDPLTITTAIFGLLAAAGKVATILEAISSTRNPPEAIAYAQTEVRHAEIALRSMQPFIEGLDVAASTSRQRMIQVDDLRVTLADAMLAFSSFEVLLLRMAGTRQRLWYLYKTRVEEHMARIQRHKLSLTLMLNVLQWCVPLIGQRLGCMGLRYNAWVSLLTHIMKQLG